MDPENIETSVYVMLDDVKIGAIKTLNVNEERDGEVVGIHLHAHPMRILCHHLDRLFQRGQVHPAAQRIPLDIVVEDVLKGVTIKTTIANFWIDSIGSSYSGEEFVVLADVKGKAESIESVQSGSGSKGTSALPVR